MSCHYATGLQSLLLLHGSPLATGSTQQESEIIPRKTTYKGSPALSFINVFILEMISSTGDIHAYNYCFFPQQQGICEFLVHQYKCKLVLWDVNLVQQKDACLDCARPWFSSQHHRERTDFLHRRSIPFFRLSRNLSTNVHG